jgi:AcrR family transcriptional regulator
MRTDSNLIRCVAFYGKSDALTRGEVERLARRTQVRNAALEVTGCLFYFGGHFVQVLEGRFNEVDRLYGTFASDVPDSDVIGLVDNIIQTRVFSGWTMKFVEGGTRVEQGRADFRPAARQERRFEIDAAKPAQAGSIALLTRDLERRVSRHLRVMPQQARAKQTVERLLDAVSGMIATSATFHRLTLESAAALAGVTQQSAYRYFANIDDLIRAAVRRMQAHWNARFVDFMVEQAFDTELDVADAAVAYVAQTYENQIRASARLKRDLLCNYHDIEYEAAWTVAEAVAGPIASAGAPVPRIGVAEMAAGLTALWAVAKSLALQDEAQLERPAVRRMMTDMFLAALNAPLRGGADRLARRN